MKNNEPYIYFRKVLFEKFDLERTNLLTLKERLYDSIFESQKSNSLTEDAFKCLSEMTDKVIKQNKYYTPNMYGEMFHYSLESCLKGIKYFRFEKCNGNYNECYNFFLTLIYRGLFGTT